MNTISCPNCTMTIELPAQPQRSERCPGPRQKGHPLIYESHCDHGETKAHYIASPPATAAQEKPQRSEWEKIAEKWGLVAEDDYNIRVGHHAYCLTGPVAAHVAGQANSRLMRAITESHKPPAQPQRSEKEQTPKPTGRRYGSVDELLKGENVSQEVINEYNRLQTETSDSAKLYMDSTPSPDTAAQDGWRVVCGEEIWHGNKCLGAAVSEQQAERICDAHNAAMQAERNNTKLAIDAALAKAKE